MGVQLQGQFRLQSLEPDGNLTSITFKVWVGYSDSLYVNPLEYAAEQDLDTSYFSFSTCQKLGYFLRTYTPRRFQQHFELCIEKDTIRPGKYSVLPLLQGCILIIVDVYAVLECVFTQFERQCPSTFRSLKFIICPLKLYLKQLVCCTSS